jgi:hypothetical protein
MSRKHLFISWLGYFNLCFLALRAKYRSYYAKIKGTVKEKKGKINLRLQEGSYV